MPPPNSLFLGYRPLSSPGVRALPREISGSYHLYSVHVSKLFPYTNTDMPFNLIFEMISRGTSYARRALRKRIKEAFSIYRLLPSLPFPTGRFLAMG